MEPLIEPTNQQAFWKFVIIDSAGAVLQFAPRRQEIVISAQMDRCQCIEGSL